jgi:uncharacterized protein YacL
LNKFTIKKETIGYTIVFVIILLATAKIFLSEKYLWIVDIGAPFILLIGIIAHIYFYKTQKKDMNMSIKPKYLLLFLLFLISIIGLSSIFLVITCTFIESIPYPIVICILTIIFSYLIIYLVFLQYRTLSEHENAIEDLLSRRQ